MATVISEFCEVVQATDGQHGLETAFNTIPDVIISDIMMPGRDGFSLCQQLRHDERTSHIPIILLTARSDDDAYIEGIGKGADVYLPQPFNLLVLKSYVRNLFTTRTKLREKFALHNTMDPEHEQKEPCETD